MNICIDKYEKEVVSAICTLILAGDKNITPYKVSHKVANVSHTKVYQIIKKFTKGI